MLFFVFLVIFVVFYHFGTDFGVYNFKSKTRGLDERGNREKHRHAADGRTHD